MEHDKSRQCLLDAGSRHHYNELQGDNMKIIASLLITVLVGYATDYDRIPLLRWAGPEGTQPETYEEWITTHPVRDFKHYLQEIIYGDGRQGDIAILIDNAVYGSLTNELTQLCQNLQSEGYTIHSHTISGGTPEEVKTLLQNLYNTNAIEGALLIGNIPVAWFEIADDFHAYGYADFPCDLFFMDLDGTWLDTMDTGNNKYDGHTGNITPEIYIGRLYPNGIDVDSLLLQNYFAKDNAFRHDTLLLTQRALVFVDDDWIPWAGWWAENVSLLYADTMNYWDAETTRASVYRQKLDTVQTWVSVFAHSWPGGHQFSYNNGTMWDMYYSSEYTSQNPPANFYNFFACSFSRYTASGNCGGSRAIFTQNYGVGSIGSTKTGSMLEFEYFYEPLAQGKNLGIAFRDWFTYITGDGVTFDELCWHYGMTLLGDCYLIPRGHNYAVAENETGEIGKNLFSLLGNPVNTRVHASITLPYASDITISLIPLDGRVITQNEYYIPAGTHPFHINMTDEKGNALPNGVYMLRIATEKSTFTAKIVKIN